MDSQQRARKNKHHRVTLAEVAKLANVSGITVSRVINEPDKVSPKRRQQVQEAIDALGYVPNQSASALASARSRVLGVVIPSLSNLVFTDVLRGIYDVAGSSGYKVLMVDTDYSAQEEERLVRTLLSQSPEGMIVTGGEQTSASQRLLLNAHIPLVQIMDLLDDPLDMNVGVSHYRAGREVAEQMLASGYERLGFLGARMDTRTQKRLVGFKDFLEEGGRYRSDLVVTSLQPSSVELGGQLFRDLMASADGVPDAVFCCNDDLALGALFESQRMGIEVPSQLGLCGFNDLGISAFTNPALSSVSVPRYEMGAEAARRLIATLNGQRPADLQCDLGFGFRARGSLARGGAR